MIRILLHNGDQTELSEGEYARIEGEWLVCYDGDGRAVRRIPQISVSAVEDGERRRLSLAEPDALRRPHRRRRHHAA